jgi:hypothetical protein
MNPAQRSALAWQAVKTNVTPDETMIGGTAATETKKTIKRDTINTGKYLKS